MRRWKNMVRCAALALLLLAAGDILVLDLFSLNGCADFSGALEEANAGPEDCFCCCVHVVAQPVAGDNDFVGLVTVADVSADLRPPSSDLEPIYHPPRL
jgi:hypothetical protein